MHCGQIFSSFDVFETALKQYENEKKQKFVIKCSRTIGAAKKILKRNLNEKLKYYEAHFVCVHGGPLRSRGKGIRKTRTHKMNCPASIKIRATALGNCLEIRQFIENHENHDTSKMVYDHGSSDQSPDSEEKCIVEHLLEDPTDKKPIETKQETCSTEKMSTLKDLSNITYDMKNASNNSNPVVKELEEVYKCNVHSIQDSSSHFKALYFTTESMRQAVKSWPAFVTLDGPYNPNKPKILINLGFSVFVVLVEDSNGQSVIVAVALTAEKDSEAFYYWFLNRFKEDNCVTEGQIKCIMGDKDLVEKNVVKEVFPEVPVYISLFHTLKTMKKEITKEKMNITNEERIKALQLLENLAYSRSEEEYHQRYEILQKFFPQSVVTYYNKNWHPLRHKWTVYSMCHGDLINRSNNQIESINSKLKKVIEKSNSLSQFIDSFFIFFNSHEQEKNNRTARLTLTRSITTFGKDSCESKYEEYLTSHASKYVQSQIVASEKVQLSPKASNLHQYQATSESDELRYDVSTSTCTCINFTSILLPCRHILAVRKFENVSLFDKDLCSERWSRQYHLKHQKVTAIDVGTQPVSETDINERRKRALALTNSLANLISLSSGNSFDYRMKVLEDIDMLWRQGHEVAISHIYDTIPDTDDVVKTEAIDDEMEAKDNFVAMDDLIPAYSSQ